MSIVPISALVLVLLVNGPDPSIKSCHIYFLVISRSLRCKVSSSVGGVVIREEFD